MKGSGFITKHTKLFFHILLLFCSLILANFIMLLFPALKISGDNQFSDALFRIRYMLKGREPVYNWISTINLFDSTLYKIGQYRSERALYTEIIKKLKRLNVASVACDISFRDKFQSGEILTDNDLLGQAAEEAGNVYFPIILLTGDYSAVSSYGEIISNNSDSNREEIKTLPVWHPAEKGKSNAYKAFFYLLPMPGICKAARGMGHINYEPDFDGKLRQIPLLYSYQDGYIPSLALRVVCDYLQVLPENITIHWGKYLQLKNAHFPYGPKKDIHIPIDERGRIFLNFAAPAGNSFYHYTFDDILQRAEKSREFTELSDQLENNLVILSDASTYTKDFSSTVFDKVYPLGNVHAVIANSILTDNFLSGLSFPEYFPISLLFFCALLFLSLKLKPAAFSLSAMALYICYVSGNALIFLFSGKVAQVSIHTAGTLFFCLSAVFSSFVIMDKEHALLLIRMEANRKINAINSRLRIKKKQLENANTRLKKANKYKTLFLENITHEFRTPLTLILGPLHHLLACGADPVFTPVEKQLQMAVSNAGRLLNLINQLLDVLKSGTGALKLKVQPVDLVPLIRRCMDSFLPELNQKELTVSFESRAASLVCYADVEKLETVINNLLSNAVKFSGQKGVIRITVSAAAPGQSADQENWVILSVKDTGPGIPGADREKIFNRFYQAGKTAEQGKGGVGIGLYLVKQYMRLHHGTVMVNSITGKGAEFIVRFPADKDAYAPEERVGEKVQKEQPGAYLAAGETGGSTGTASDSQHTAAIDLPVRKKLFKESILVVDDDPRMREYIKVVLEGEYIIHETRDWKEALQLLTTLAPHLIIYDLIMQERDGNALLSCLKKHKKTRAIPLICITAKSSFGEKLKTGDIQPDDYLSKPFHPAELKARINNLLKLSSYRLRIEAYQHRQVLINNRYTEQPDRKQVLYPSEPLLIIDDDAEMLEYYGIMLRENGMTNLLFCRDESRVSGLLQNNICSVIILDLKLPVIPGRQLMEQIHEKQPAVPVLIVTGVSAIESAVDCMKAGAFDYMIKPVDANRLITNIKKAIEINSMQAEILSLRRKIFSCGLENPEHFSGIITNNAKMKTIFQYIEAVASTLKPILITGESGVGKELIARSIHNASGLKGDFVAVNIAGLDDAMFSDTLFGHKKSAFTGALTGREGLIKKAENGSLFLDEIGDLPPVSQVKLLRLLQEGEYYPLGADKAEASNARIMAATNIDIELYAEQKKFRNDLYYRLITHHIALPALRERLADDLPFLVEHFLAESAAYLKKRKPTAPGELITLLKTYSFPGNIRELQSMIFDAVSRHTAKKLSLSYFKEYIQKHKQGAVDEAACVKKNRISYAGEFPTLKEAEDFFIKQAMEKAGGNQSVAAHLLGISSSTLSRRFKTGENNNADAF